MRSQLLNRCSKELLQCKLSRSVSSFRYLLCLFVSSDESGFEPLHSSLLSTWPLQDSMPVSSSPMRFLWLTYLRFTIFWCGVNHSSCKVCSKPVDVWDIVNFYRTKSFALCYYLFSCSLLYADDIRFVCK